LTQGGIQLFGQSSIEGIKLLWSIKGENANFISLFDKNRFKGHVNPLSFHLLKMATHDVPTTTVPLD
jgi:hypothetical protein